MWDELAACIKWARRNEDVLADTHWVGGNPWDQNQGDGDIYGWAAWNPAKCTLTLRNSFSDQRWIPALVGKAVDIDQEIRITLNPQEVVVLEGVCAAGAEKAASGDDKAGGDSAKGKKKKKGKKSGKGVSGRVDAA